MKDDKPKNPANLYQRADSWILDFFFKGMRYTESLGCVSRGVAKERRDKRKTEAADGKLTINGMHWTGSGWEDAAGSDAKITDLLFEVAVEKYLTWYAANRAAYSHLKYALPASKALKASFDGKKLSQISPFSIEEHKLNRKRKPDLENPDRKPRTDTTINHDLTFLRSMFNKCITWKYARRNPMDDVELFKLDNGRTRHLSTEEAEKLLAACGPDLRLLVLTALHTGFRKKEVCSLKWSAVDLVGNAITVDSGYAKNNEARSVPLTSDLAAGLQKLKDSRKPKQEDVVFLYEGRPWTTWRKSFNSALSLAGIVDFRWHDLRHSFGSWLAMAGMPDKLRMELMGHKDPKMTLRYTHLSPGYKQQAVDRLPQFGKAIMESESQQISQQSDVKVKVAFRK